MGAVSRGCINTVDLGIKQEQNCSCFSIHSAIVSRAVPGPTLSPTTEAPYQKTPQKPDPTKLWTPLFLLDDGWCHSWLV